MIRRRQRALSVIGVALAGLLLSGIGASPALAIDHDGAITPDADECRTGAPVALKDAPALALLQADAVAPLSTGTGVLVAIVDSGINGSDPRLSPRIAGGVNLVPDGADPRGLTDLDGHGTAIAGLIAAQPRKDSGVHGLAPDAQLYSVRVYATKENKDADAGLGPSTARTAQGIRVATDAGAQIINVSMSTPYSSAELDSAVAYALSRGSLVVASSGNATEADRSFAQDDLGDGPRFPAGSPGAIGVAAATVPGGVVTDDSKHGPHVAIIAPGQSVLTTALNKGDCYFGEAPASSYATGYASAVAALVASTHPTESPDEWAYRMMATALRASPDERDDRSGWGLVQPFEAITLVPGPDTRGPANPFQGGAVPAPAATGQSIVIAASDDQDELDASRVTIVATVGAALLCVFGVIGVYRATRRRTDAAA